MPLPLFIPYNCPQCSTLYHFMYPVTLCYHTCQMNALSPFSPVRISLFPLNFHEAFLLLGFFSTFYLSFNYFLFRTLFSTSSTFVLRLIATSPKSSKYWWILDISNVGHCNFSTHFHRSPLQSPVITHTHSSKFFTTLFEIATFAVDHSHQAFFLPSFF